MNIKQRIAAMEQSLAAGIAAKNAAEVTAAAIEPETFDAWKRRIEASLQDPDPDDHIGIANARFRLLTNEYYVRQIIEDIGARLTPEEIRDGDRRSVLVYVLFFAKSRTWIEEFDEDDLYWQYLIRAFKERKPIPTRRGGSKLAALDASLRAARLAELEADWARIARKPWAARMYASMAPKIPKTAELIRVD